MSCVQSLCCWKMPALLTDCMRLSKRVLINSLLAVTVCSNVSWNAFISVLLSLLIPSVHHHFGLVLLRVLLRMKGCIFWLGGEFSSNFCDLVLPNDDRVLLIRGLCYAELEASRMSRVSINPTFQGAQELSRVKWRGPRMLGDLEAEKETKNLRASSRNCDSGEKRYASISRS